MGKSPKPENNMILIREWQVSDSCMKIIIKKKRSRKMMVKCLGEEGII